MGHAVRSGHESDITGGVIWKQLLGFFFPILLGTFFQQLYNTVDAIVVGQFVGKQALAAVGGTTGTITMLFVNFFVGLSSGATVIISQFYGAQNTEDVGRAVRTAMALSITVGAVFTVLGIVLSPWALHAMDTPEDIVPGALVYLRTYFGGIIFPLVYNMGTGILRAVGDSRRPLYFLIVCCIVNLVLDLVLVAGLGLGVFGAAIATVLSQLVSAVLVLLALVHSDQSYHLDIRHIGFTGRILRNIILIGLPAGLQSVMYSLSNIIIQRSVNSFGTDIVAAYTAYGKIDGLFWMTMGAFGVCVTTFVGQNFGAQNYARMRETVRVTLLLATIATVVMSTLLYFGGPLVYRLFTDDRGVIAEGMRILQFLVPLYFTYICVEVLAGAVRGTGDAVLPMVITCFGVCVLRIVWIAVAVPMRPDIITVVASYPITWSTTSILFVIYYLQGGWLKRQIRRHGYEPEKKGSEPSAC